jgi:pyruvate,water dikinase
MNLVIPLEAVAEAGVHRVGGKAFSLGILASRGIRVPRTLCITTEAYDLYARSTGLLERISLELSRKDFTDMRWEELWDASLRIRGMFLNTAMPRTLLKKLMQPIEEFFGDTRVAVRSSAPGEDSSEASFAGLHESYLNVTGIYAILDHIRLVWASLWSDAALLYRRELGLDVHHSSMAVTLQELVDSERSGVFFGRNPADPSQAVIEAVYGLNQGLVDGAVEPDRWIIHRSDGSIIGHDAAVREGRMVPGPAGVVRAPLPPELSSVPPLDEGEVLRVVEVGMRVEEFYGSPQDMEWTMSGPDLYVLQARPVTAGGSGQADDRAWYRSLSRSYDNLSRLWVRIEEELVPEMVSVAERLDDQGLRDLDDRSLALEIETRVELCALWERTYREHFIPFAQGMRLFGRFYNDTVRPQDPYEFMDLLRSDDLISIRRNRRIEELAAVVREDPTLVGALTRGDLSRHPGFQQRVRSFLDEFGDLPCATPGCAREGRVLYDVVLRHASRHADGSHPSGRSTEFLEEYYLLFFPDEQQAFARELLRLARASYRLRDDDNIYLDRIKVHLKAALDEARRRLGARADRIGDDDIPRALRDPSFISPEQAAAECVHVQAGFAVRMRQLVGQPAGSGIATGVARVVSSPQELAAFCPGEVMVCDAIDPTMTFMVPLAAAIVERRGGMLIHGAIIAREYGLPCVTGVPHAVELIGTGDVLTVDGYLGIVTISEGASQRAASGVQSHGDGCLGGTEAL